MTINTKADFDSIVERMQKLVDIYENHYANGNRYMLFLANGDTISFDYGEKYIPHLLGLNTTYLSKYDSKLKTSSYGTLQYFLENSYSIYNDLSKNKAFNNVFSNYVEEKLDIFEKQIDPPYPNSIDFVCKYDRSKTYNVKEVDGMTSDYIIGRKNSNGDLILLGIVKDDKSFDEKNYCVQTSRVIKNDGRFDEEISDLLKNQEVTYVTGMIVTNSTKNYLNKVSINTVEIGTALNNLKSYYSLTGCIPNTVDGHLYNLNTLFKEKEKRYIGSDIMKKIADKEIIELKEDDRNKFHPSIIALINEHNDYVVATSNIDSLTRGTFSEIKDERDNLKKELEELKETLKLEQQRRKELENQTENQEQELTEYKAIADSVLNVSEEIKRVRTKED